MSFTPATARRRMLCAFATATVLSGAVAACGSEPAPTSRPAKIVFADDRQSVFVMNADGSEVTRIGAGGDPGFAPDGARIVVGGSSITTMDPDGGNPMRLADWGYHPTFSADGKRIAYVRAGVIHVMNSDGGHQEQLTTADTSGADRASSQEPAFSPDGAQLAFTRAGAIWLMAADGTGARPLLADAHFNSNPVFTPDGTGLVFTSNRGGKDRSEIYTMNLDGTDIRLLHDEATSGPAFSPDGAKILFTRVVREPASGAEVWVMNRDGSDAHRLTDPNRIAQQPSWGGGAGA
ncbi:TolB family protein [Nocardia huaxiensis]|uniref:TolB family protein n=1 Tax=Nocardia huaxiensis TaxID=2755382 RepID=UPI001E3C87DA|nr:hypothetical protein [Nocardia huaxiensis]UFS97021.1 hypothetical protein LPY97_03550 [Nocardia huaxiensis]